jgi:hypothetical protein
MKLEENWVWVSLDLKKNRNPISTWSGNNGYTNEYKRNF